VFAVGATITLPFNAGNGPTPWSIDSVVALLLVHVSVTFCPAAIVVCEAVSVTDGSGFGVGVGVLLLPLPQPVSVNIDTKSTKTEK